MIRAERRSEISKRRDLFKITNHPLRIWTVIGSEDQFAIVPQDRRDLMEELYGQKPHERMSIFRPGIGKKDIYSFKAGSQKVLGKKDAGVAAHQANIV